MIEFFYAPLDDTFYNISILKDDRFNIFKVRKMSPSFLRLARFSENFMNIFGVENIKVKLLPDNAIKIRMYQDG